MAKLGGVDCGFDMQPAEEGLDALEGFSISAGLGYSGVQLFSPPPTDRGGLFNLGQTHQNGVVTYL